MIKKGDKVKMSVCCKTELINSGCKDHVTEFGDCTGLVEDPIWPNGEGPEVNVRWEPSGLVYGYDPKIHLEKI